MDVIVTAGAASTRPAKEATVTIPIVMAFDNDPVGSGFVAGLARPGGNITGLSQMAPELCGKTAGDPERDCPETFTRSSPRGVNNPGNAQALKEKELAAGAFGIQIQSLDVRIRRISRPHFERQPRDGLTQRSCWGAPSPLLSERHIVELATKSRLPMIYYSIEYMDDWWLYVLRPGVTELCRRAAIYMDRILKGARPVEVPVERPKKVRVYH